MSFDPNLISINYNTGRAQANKQGQTVIQYKDSSEYNISVTIQRIDKLKTNARELTNI